MSWFKMDWYTNKTPRLLNFWFDNLKIWLVLIDLLNWLWISFKVNKSYFGCDFFWLLSSSLLWLIETQYFGHCILWTSSGVSCLSGHRKDSIWEIRLNHFYVQINKAHLRKARGYSDQNIVWIHHNKDEDQNKDERPKHCVWIHHNKDEENSLKNHSQNNTHQVSSQISDSQ